MEEKTLKSVWSFFVINQWWTSSMKKLRRRIKFYPSFVKKKKKSETAVETKIKLWSRFIALKIYNKVNISSSFAETLTMRKKKKKTCFWRDKVFFFSIDQQLTRLFNYICPSQVDYSPSDVYELINNFFFHRKKLSSYFSTNFWSIKLIKSWKKK